MGIIKVAIADDHKIFRKGVILSLRPYTNIKFVLEAENGTQAAEILHQVQDITILLTDIIEINITNLAGVPSIVYGLLALGHLAW